MGIAPLARINYIQLDAVWTAPVEEADDYDYTFFQDMIDACTGCQILEFANDTEPMSTSWEMKVKAVPSGHEFPFPFRHYSKNFLQTSSYPGPEETEAMVELIDQAMPTVNDTYLLYIQFLAFTQPNDPQRALPWQDDILGLTFNFHYPDLAMKPMFDAITANTTTATIELFGGEDHRMFWAPHPDNPDLAVDWPQYFESREKFERLQEIKACVDPTGIFRNKMTIPLPDGMVAVQLVQPEDMQSEQLWQSASTSSSLNSVAFLVALLGCLFVNL